MRRFCFQISVLIPLLNEVGRLTSGNRSSWGLGLARERRPYGAEEGSESGTDMKLNMPELPPATLFTALGSYNLLPAIVFLPMRRRCDQAAAEAAFMRRDPNVGRRDARRDFMQNFYRNTRKFAAIGTGTQSSTGGIASHHAGHIPAWKLVIEKLMSCRTAGCDLCHCDCCGGC